MEVLGFTFAAELNRHGYELSSGALYPVLHGLAQAGYLESAARAVCHPRAILIVVGRIVLRQQDGAHINVRPEFCTG